MTECDVRGECFRFGSVHEVDEESGIVVRLPLSVRAWYECGFENVGTVDNCPKRKRLKQEGQE